MPVPCNHHSYHPKPPLVDILKVLASVFLGPHVFMYFFMANTKIETEYVLGRLVKMKQLRLFQVRTVA